MTDALPIYLQLDIREDRSWPNLPAEVTRELTQFINTVLQPPEAFGPREGTDLMEVLNKTWPGFCAERSSGTPIDAGRYQLFVQDGTLYVEDAHPSFAVASVAEVHYVGDRGLVCTYPNPGGPNCLQPATSVSVDPDASRSPFRGRCSDHEGLLRTRTPDNKVTVLHYLPTAFADLQPA